VVKSVAGLLSCKYSVEPARAALRPLVTAAPSLAHLTCSLLSAFPSPSPPLTIPQMAEAASGSADRSVQVKLVLLGKITLFLVTFLQQDKGHPGSHLGTPLSPHPTDRHNLFTQAKLPWANLPSSSALYVSFPPSLNDRGFLTHHEP